MTRLTLLSPLPGWVSPLDEVPDAVFAGGMMGDGVAIDPTGTQLVAPCAATVLSVHAARHAVTLRTDDGADVLIHLGIDTVQLDGRGFLLHATEGDQVAVGTPLISWNPSEVVAGGRSAMCPVVVLDVAPESVTPVEVQTVEPGAALLNVQ